MGWASAGGVFIPVARKIVALDVTDEAKIEVLAALIEALQDMDWDTESESLDLFTDVPVVVEAFRRQEIFLCCEERGPAGDWCEGERGHAGDVHGDALPEEMRIYQ